MTLWCIVILTLVCTHLTDTKNAFVFGGNGQLGLPLVKMLLRRKYDVTILNRGNNYYDSEKELKSLGDVRVITCDRFRGLKRYCKRFTEYLSKSNKIDLVLDVNGFTKKHMREATEAFADKDLGLYVFISPDNIYEVCEKDHDEFTREEDDMRPADKDEYERYANGDQFGHWKLLAEEYLRYESGLKYLILRCPDIIGERDTTLRFWIYQMWIKYMEVLKTPVSLPEEVKNIQSSYSYVPDIVSVLERALERGIYNEVFNIAMSESINLEDLLRDIARSLKVHLHLNREVSLEESYHLYPSTGRGPLDITKAQKLLGFKPTPLNIAVDETVNYYNGAVERFPSEALKVVAEVVNNVLQDSSVSETFKKAVNIPKVYDLQSSHHSEL